MQHPILWRLFYFLLHQQLFQRMGRNFQYRQLYILAEQNYKYDTDLLASLSLACPIQFVYLHHPAFAFSGLWLEEENAWYPKELLSGADHLLLVLWRLILVAHLLPILLQQCFRQPSQHLSSGRQFDQSAMSGRYFDQSAMKPLDAHLWCPLLMLLEAVVAVEQRKRLLRRCLASIVALAQWKQPGLRRQLVLKRQKD